jgi:hypothetical protein
MVVRRDADVIGRLHRIALRCRQVVAARLSLVEWRMVAKSVV